jgi:hypothetical protein
MHTCEVKRTEDMHKYEKKKKKKKKRKKEKRKMNLTMGFFFCQNCQVFGSRWVCCSVCLGEDFLVPALKCR